MSVYRDNNSTVTFVHPIGGPLTATIYSVDNLTTPVVDAQSVTPVSNGDGTYSYTLAVPYSAAQYDGKLNVVWSNGGSFTRTQPVNVVTPIVSLARLKTIYDDGSNPGAGDLYDLENTIRVIIESFCGQGFGYSVGSKTYTGNGSGKIALKQRLFNFQGILGVYGGYESDFVSPTGQTNLNGELNLDRASVAGDGWSVLMNWPQYLTVRESPPIELLNIAPSQDGTIRVPNRFYNNRDFGTSYTIYGEWGYDAVPDEVQEAAMLIANDYVTGDSGYRDRYLQILKIQQDSFTYHSNAFTGTGNARADQLLTEYRRQMGMTII
jgi:hypothetical protein